MISSETIFRVKQQTKIHGLPIWQLLELDHVAGDIGIEIEVEGNKFKKEGVVTPWGFHKDGSLRGYDNAEYVLNRPILFKEVPKAIKDLWKMFDDFGSVLDESNRTSVHVHLNMQDFYLNRLCSFIAIYLSIEEVLTYWCGDHRVGNLFCLRAKDAPAIVSQVKTFLTQNGRARTKDGMHYAGMNVSALHKFGSIEIRALRGVTDPGIILDWVSILERIYLLSAEYKDPRDVCEGFSGGGPLTYLSNILGDKYDKVVTESGMGQQEMMESLYEGIRLAQDLCYCRDWSLYEPVDIKTNPFGRKAKMVSPGSSPLYSGNYNITMQATAEDLAQFAAQYSETLASTPTSLVPPAPPMHEDLWSIDEADAWFSAQEAEDSENEDEDNEDNEDNEEDEV